MRVHLFQEIKHFCHSQITRFHDLDTCMALVPAMGELVKRDSVDDRKIQQINPLLQLQAVLFKGEALSAHFLTLISGGLHFRELLKILFESEIVLEFQDEESKLDKLASIQIRDVKELEKHRTSVKKQLIGFKGAGLTQLNSLRILRGLYEDTYSNVKPETSQHISNFKHYFNQVPEVKNQGLGRVREIYGSLQYLKKVQFLRREKANQMDRATEPEQERRQVDIKKEDLRSVSLEDKRREELEELKSNESGWEQQFGEGVFNTLDKEYERDKRAQDQKRESYIHLSTALSLQSQSKKPFRLLKLFTCAGEGDFDRMQIIFQQRLKLVLKPSIYVEVQIGGRESARTDFRSGLYCLQFEMPSDAIKGADGLYFIGIERNTGGQDLLNFAFNQMPVESSRVLMALYVDLLKPAMMLQFKHRKIKGLHHKDKDRSRGYYKPTNFLTRMKPSLWTPKYEILGEKQRVSVRDFQLRGLEFVTVRIGCAWPGNLKND